MAPSGPGRHHPLPPRLHAALGAVHQIRDKQVLFILYLTNTNFSYTYTAEKERMSLLARVESLA